MRSTDQQAYDRGITIFSPDGRLYQVEYAREAVRNGSPTVGVRVADAVVLASRRRPRSSLVEAESMEKLHDLDGRLGVATAGHVADARRLVDYARRYAQRERLRYGEAPGVEPVAKALADFVQESTQTGGTRPFGAALLVGGVTETGPRLYRIGPSGTPDAWRAAAVGSGVESIRGFLEDEHEAGFDAEGAGLDAEEAVSLALRALAEGADDDFTVPEIDVAVLDEEGYEAFDRDRRASAMDDAGLSSAS